MSIPNTQLRFAQLTWPERPLAEEVEKLDELTGEPDPIDLALLRSKLDAAQTLLEESQERLTDAIGLMAPSDGFVSRVNAEEGEDVEANDVVAVLVDTKRGRDRRHSR